MDIFDGECFERLINQRFFDVIDPGPLYHPINKIKITRDEKQQLILETEAVLESKTRRQESLPGMVTTNNSVSEFTVLDNKRVTLKGVTPHSSQDHYDTFTTEGNYRAEQSGVWELEVTLGDTNDATFLIEWLDNLDDGRYLFPNLISDKIQTLSEKIFRSEKSDFEVNITRTNQGGSRNCIHSQIEGIEYYLVITKRHEKGSKAKGYILYTSIPSKEVRNKLRGAMSFVLGRPLIYLGHTQFSKDWDILSTHAKSANTYDGRAYDIHSLPPAPLSLDSYNTIDPIIFTNAVTSIYQKYEDLNLEVLLWNYWHAVVASLAMAAAHWGALLESIIKIASSAPNFNIQNTICVDKNEWSSCRLSLIKLVSALELDAGLQKILINKVNNLNQLPQSEINKKFLKEIGLEISSFELEVWKNRNRAAHGVSPKPDDLTKLIREIKVLKVLWHRIVLAVTEANQYYIDYYSINFPIRKLKDSVPHDD